MRGKWLGIITILLLAPITAELLQAYLGDLGGLGGFVFTVLFFAPMYGGMALLIREVSVRTGRGWSGRLLLATAWGVAMPTVVDLSLFTPARDDIDDWDQIINAASFGGLGWYAVVIWVGGHVLMSVSAPIIVAETLARRPGPWLGPFGLCLTTVGMLAVAGFIHGDQVRANTTDADLVDYVVSAAIIACFAGLAFTPLGRPLPSRSGRTPSVAVSFVAGLVGMAGLDFIPMSWAGVAVYMGFLVTGLFLVGRWATSPGWTPRHLAALALGALLTRTATGFLSPLPDGTTWAEKITQNCVSLALVLLLGCAMHRRTHTLNPDLS